MSPAEYIYAALRAHSEYIGAPIVPAPWHQRTEDFRTQFTTACQAELLNPSSDPEAVHNRWWQEYKRMGWVYGDHYSQQAKTHPDMVPYNDLAELERRKDTAFMLVCRLAALGQHFNEQN